MEIADDLSGSSPLVMFMINSRTIILKVALWRVKLIKYRKRMMITFNNIVCYAVACGAILLQNCKGHSPISVGSGQRVDSNITITPGKVTVACYYFPNWGPVQQSEWTTIKFAKPKFSGHQQPKVPLWGYENEQDPGVMTKKIDAASTHGIDVFIFDWYYYDDGPYLEKALDSGFLRASNNDKIKFALLWCNHDVGAFKKGAVRPETFDKITDEIITKYFKNPSYWKIDGCPFFSIYQFTTFLETFGGDITKAVAALERFREKVKAAGFPDLHLDGSLWDLKAGHRDAMIEQLGINSTSTYTWVHHIPLSDFPVSEYAVEGDAYFNAVLTGGGHNGLETPAGSLKVPYYLNVSMGWDPSPRCGAVTAAYWLDHKSPYPFGPVLEGNSPEQFKKYLARAKSLTMKNPEDQRIIIINSWNEWGEGSYLEPDTVHRMDYLDAVRDVFYR